MKGKVCKSCWLWCPLEDLDKGTGCIYGRKRLCKKCRKKRDKSKYEANKEELRAFARKKYHDNIEDERLRSRVYHTKNKHKANEKSSLWYNKNKELKKKYSENWREQNKDKVKTYSAKRRALKLSTQVEVVDYATIYGRDEGICHLCGQFVEVGDVHMDHVIPLSKGGTHTYDNIKVSHSWCNLRKGAKIENVKL